MISVRFPYGYDSFDAPGEVERNILHPKEAAGQGQPLVRSIK